jgi:hypothetical protein
MAALWGGIITAVIAAVVGLLVGMKQPILYIPALLLIGVGPVLGFQLAARHLGWDWKTIVGGIIASIIPALTQIILWPLFVWLFNRKFSFLKLWGGSLLGLVLGVIVWYIIAFTMGQNPDAWWSLAWTLALSIWGGTAAAFMVAAYRGE